MIIEYNKVFSLSNPNFKKLTGYLLANLNKDPYCPVKLCFNLGEILLEKDQRSARQLMSREINATELDINKLYFLGHNYFEDMIAIHKLNGNVYEFYISDDTHKIMGDNLKDYGDSILRDVNKLIEPKKIEAAHEFLNKLHLFI